MTTMLVAYFRNTTGPAMFSNMDEQEVKNMNETRRAKLSPCFSLKC